MIAETFFRHQGQTNLTVLQIRLYIIFVIVFYRHIKKKFCLERNCSESCYAIQLRICHVLLGESISHTCMHTFNF